MQCPRCGAALADGTFAACPQCGLPLAAPPTGQNPPAAPAQSLAPPQMEGTPPGFPPYFTPPAPTKRRKTRLFVALSALAALIIVASLGALTVVLSRSPHVAHVVATTPTATTIPGPTSTPQVFFQDPLTSNTKGWFTDEHCFFEKDGLHVTNRNCIVPVGRLGNVDVKVDAKIVSEDPSLIYGIVVRITTGANDCVFEVSGEAIWTVACVTNGDVTTIKYNQFSPYIRQYTGVVNSLEVRAVGNHYEFSVNGNLLIQFDFSGLIDGYVGLNSDTGLETVFSNLQIGYP